MKTSILILFTLFLINNVVAQKPEIANIDTATNAMSIRIARISGGKGTALLTCHVTYIDPGDGLQKSEDKTIVISYSVTGSPHGVKLSLPFN